jgi:hypothetical protein
MIEKMSKMVGWSLADSFSVCNQDLLSTISLECGRRARLSRPCCRVLGRLGRPDRLAARSTGGCEAVVRCVADTSSALEEEERATPSEEENNQRERSRGEASYWKPESKAI